MTQFSTILKFELMGYFKNKIFVGITIFLVAVIAAVMFFPRIIGKSDPDAAVPAAERPVMLVKADDQNGQSLIQQAFSEVFGDYDVRVAEESLEDIQEEIISARAACAFVMDGMTSYTYYVNNLAMQDQNTMIADEVLQELYRMKALTESGISPETAQSILTMQISHEITNLGVDQMQNFFYTYIMVFALYMVILLYGQMVATNVATEKSSRAMEVLITSAKPTAMMFGKVIASCFAGFIQLILVFGSAIVCFRLNEDYWDGNIVIESIFNMPIHLFVYMLIFFVLGFFIYAFLFGAVGSMASKLEDINTSSMPVILLFIAGFFIVIFSMSNGSVDSTLMKVCSYIPFTSPMSMFTRIAMSTVPFYEIIISIAVLIAGVIAVGVLAAKIYRVGVLLYGAPPKINSIFTAMKRT